MFSVAPMRISGVGAYQPRENITSETLDRAYERRA